MYTEWTLYDSETNRLRLCTAYSQEDAIRKAISWNVVPRQTDDVRPRIARSDSVNSIMAPEEFQNFIDSLSGP